MKIDVKEIYKGDSWIWCDYQPMLDAFGKIAIQVDDKDCQGDSRLLYDENGKIGLLVFGWGSCSGCDALQACNSLEEVQKLCDSLQEDIKWFDDKKQALEYLTNHDWQGDYSWHQIETKEFVNKCIGYLSAPNRERRCAGMSELKSCPFCGTSVLFEKDAFYNIYQGTCEGCTMQFRYEEKEEEITDDFIRRCGEIRITHTMPRKRRLNLPFEQVWNTRTKERGGEK